MTEQITHDYEAERAVLAACLVSKPARTEARKVLTGKDFDSPIHEVIWDAMSRLDRHDKPVDPVTINALVSSQRGAPQVMLDLVTAFAQPDQVTHHAAIVRSWATKRRIYSLATSVQQKALNPDANAVGFAATVANQFAAIRDSGSLGDDITAMTLDEMSELEEPDMDWVIEGLLERGDRLILTGGEGLGKSTMLRQIAIYAAAGLHPFKFGRRIPPIKALIYDSENSRNQIRRKIEPLRLDAAQRGQRSPGQYVMIDCPGRIDLTRDRDLARLHNLLDAQQPDVVVIGPLYRLVPRALQTDDEASPLLAALDTIKDRGIALLIEAHAGHAHGANGREWRPRGSSALMGWPEFGLGMKPVEDSTHYCDVLPWRGARDERAWPTRLRRDERTFTWTDIGDHSMPRETQEAS